jgi:hypothetical protein
LHAILWQCWPASLAVLAGETVNHEACPAAGFAGEMLDAGRRMPDVNAMAST